jgi:hypothetical protein
MKRNGWIEQLEYEGQSLGQMSGQTAHALSSVIAGAIDEYEAALQKLVDICFSVAIMVHCEERFIKRGKDGVAAYVAEQLKGCGFPAHPSGMSWGILDAVRDAR